MAADYVLAQFSFVSRLILVHGQFPSLQNLVTINQVTGIMLESRMSCCISSTRTLWVDLSDDEWVCLPTRVFVRRMVLERQLCNFCEHYGNTRQITAKRDGLVLHANDKWLVNGIIHQHDLFGSVSSHFYEVWCPLNIPTRVQLLFKFTTHRVRRVRSRSNPEAAHCRSLSLQGGPRRWVITFWQKGVSLFSIVSHWSNQRKITRIEESDCF